LKAVLDHHIWFELDQISGEPTGDLDDGLPPGVEQLGVIPGDAAVPDPVRLRRHESGGETRWVFTAATVGAVDGWFAGLPNRWALELLPPVLLRPGFGDLLWWQWIALPALSVLAWLLGLLLSRATGLTLNRLVARTTSGWDDMLIARLNGPITLAWTLTVLYVLVPLLGLVVPAEDLIHTSLRVGLFLGFFWALLRGVDVLGAFLLQSQWTQQYPASRALVPLGGRVVKAAILAMAIVGLLGELGFSVTSLVAGLGIGGLALALAAQKTGENLFAAFSIGIDQPFRVGDFVNVEGMLGNVETIGLRSTRIRTLDRTLVTVPNGKLAEMQIETFAARDRIRFNAKLGVVYETTASQMQAILAGLERTLREHPRIWPDTVVVRFAGFGDSSLDIEIMCWFQVTDYNAFRDCRQEVLLAFMDVVEKAGSGFAFPTRTVHVVGAPADLTSRARTRPA
ncbi:MAG TPA: mechanosensitive ion channel family protein, partial [Planctomycetota bacterium]|nr:mechanosensitive ion channel family protein [Planctomycetota bacterium]